MRLTPPRKNEPGYNRNGDAGGNSRNAECAFHGNADGIGLHHVTHKAEGQYDRDREEYRQEAAEPAPECGARI